MLPQQGSSFLPITGALASPTDLRVPQPKTLSGTVLPSARTASYTNQQLGGLLSGTSAVVGGAKGTPVSSPMMTGQAQQSSTSKLSDSISRTNASLMQIAQARQAALRRAAQRQGGVATSGGDAGPVPQSSPYTGGPVSFEGYTGGATFARLIPILKQRGLQVTDTYRDPEYNRRVGGVSTSFHMDKGNPAVDIGGSTAQLNALYSVLKQMGGWRQLLWQVPGHYDHIHVA